MSSSNAAQFILNMQEDILENQVTGSVYSIKTIVISAFFGGVIASGYMLYQNFKALGEPAKARKTVFIVVGIIVALMATFFIPALINTPPILYSIFLTFATSLAAKKTQEDKLRLFIKNGGQYFPPGRSVIVCILSFLALMAIATAMVGITYLLSGEDNF